MFFIRLKKTSPTAYCDCWEKCKCKALIAGNQPARTELLNRLLADTDLVRLPNSRGNNILLFLVQTVGRQMGEQRQFKPTRRTAAARKPPLSDLGVYSYCHSFCVNNTISFGSTKNAGMWILLNQSLNPLSQHS